MRDPFAHVKTGQPIEIAHQAWNAMLDAAKAFQSSQSQSAGPIGAAANPANLVVVRNDTGGNLPAFSVLVATATLVSPDDLPYEVRRRPCFAASAPSDATNQPLITIEAIPSGQFGLAAAEGVVPVVVTMTHAAHQFALPVKADTTRLTSSASGPVRILTAPDGASSGGRAVVLIGESPLGATGSNFGGIPSADAECVSVTIPCPPPVPSSDSGDGVILDWWSLGGDFPDGGRGADRRGYGDCLRAHADDPTKCLVKTTCASALIPARFVVLICNGTDKLSYYNDNPTSLLANYSANQPSGWYFSHTTPDVTATINGRLQCCGDDDPNLYFIGNVIGFDPSADTGSCGCEFQFTCACTDKQLVLTPLTAPDPTQVIRLDTGCGTVDLYIMPYTAPVAPVADFSATPLVGGDPLAVTFTDLSTHFPTSWAWDFGDSTSGSIEQNPTHVYLTPGLKTVTLTARNAVGNGVKTRANYIFVAHAYDDSYSYSTSATLGVLTVAAPGVLANDLVPSGWYPVLVSGPAFPTSGNFTFNSDGSFFYKTPTTGTDSFTYCLSDGTHTTNTATVTITVNP